MLLVKGERNIEINSYHPLSDITSEIPLLIKEGSYYIKFSSLPRRRTLYLSASAWYRGRCFHEYNTL